MKTRPSGRGHDRSDDGFVASNGRPSGARRCKVENFGKEFKVAGLAEIEGQHYGLGTYDGRFLRLPVTEEEAEKIAPNLSDDRTYTWNVEESRMIEEAEALVPEVARA